MQPDDNMPIQKPPQGGTQPPERSIAASQAAAADVTRHQIDAIYSKQAADEGRADATAVEPTPYQRNHTPSHTIRSEEWNRYHSAWQNYYQKYYEHYYMGAVRQVHQAYTSRLPSQLDQGHPTQAIGTATGNEPLSKDEAMYDLRAQLVDKVQSSAKKVRKSRHFVPLVSAIGVLLLFVFLQYNSIIIGNVKAYVTPGEIDPQNIVVDPNASLAVSKDPVLIIPKINVNVPVIYNVTPDQTSQLKAMESGLAWFGIPGANSKPGQIGNTVLSGHSSNDFTDGGKYKFVFALLDRLEKGDIFYVHYNGTRYTYNVTKIRVVKPNDVKSLQNGTTKPEVTLLTCTPLGTALNRLLVTGEQISPNPATAAKAPQMDTGGEAVTMPGTAPTLIERLFGAR